MRTERAFLTPRWLACWLAAATVSAAVAVMPPAVFASRGGATVTVAAGTGARPGGTITVTVKIENARNVGSIPFTLRYDPTILELVSASSVTEGGFLRQGGAPTTFLARPGSAARGGGVVVGLSRLGAGQGGAGARGKGTLCRMTFRALQPGVSPLTFAGAAVLDPSARPLAATFRGGSLTVKPRL